MDQKQVCAAVMRCLNRLRLAETFCDITLLVGDIPIPAHKAVLAGTSKFFHAVLSSDVATDMFQINGLSATDMLMVLDFLYTGQILVTRRNVAAIDTMAQQLQIDILTEVCSTFRMQQQQRKNDVLEAQDSATKGASRTRTYTRWGRPRTLRQPDSSGADDSDDPDEADLLDAELEARSVHMDTAMLVPDFDEVQPEHIISESMHISDIEAAKAKTLFGFRGSDIPGGGQTLTKMNPVVMDLLKSTQNKRPSILINQPDPTIALDNNVADFLCGGTSGTQQHMALPPATSNSHSNSNRETSTMRRHVTLPLGTSATQHMVLLPETSHGNGTCNGNMNPSEFTIGELVDDADADNQDEDTGGGPCVSLVDGVRLVGGTATCIDSVMKAMCGCDVANLAASINVYQQHDLTVTSIPDIPLPTRDEAEELGKGAEQHRNGGGGGSVNEPVMVEDPGDLSSLIDIQNLLSSYSTPASNQPHEEVSEKEVNDVEEEEEVVVSTLTASHEPACVQLSPMNITQSDGSLDMTTPVSCDTSIPEDLGVVLTPPDTHVESTTLEDALGCERLMAKCDVAQEVVEDMADLQPFDMAGISNPASAGDEAVGGFHDYCLITADTARLLPDDDVHCNPGYNDDQLSDLCAERVVVADPGQAAMATDSTSGTYQADILKQKQLHPSTEEGNRCEQHCGECVPDEVLLEKESDKNQLDTNHWGDIHIMIIQHPERQEAENREEEVAQKSKKKGEAMIKVEDHIEEELCDGDAGVPCANETVEIIGVNGGMAEVQQREVVMAKGRETQAGEDCQVKATPAVPAVRLQCEWCSVSYATEGQLRTHAKRLHAECMFACNFCQRLFMEQRRCEDHTDWCRVGAKVDGRYRCPQCPYTAAKAMFVVNHYRTKHTTKCKRTCGECQSTFHTLADYYDHQLQVHHAEISGSCRWKVYACTECRFKTVKPYLLESHRTSHTDERFMCSTNGCGKSFKTTIILKRHQKNVHGDDVLQCSKCSFTSKYQATMKAHAYRKHNITEQPVHHCHYCGYSSVDRANLKRHERFKHSDERSFLCSFCPKAFKHKNQLTIHEMAHTGARPFACPLCPYAGRSRVALQTHDNYRHSDAKPYACDLCEFRTKGASNLIFHKARCRRKHTEAAELLSASSEPLSVEHTELEEMPQDPDIE